IRAVYQRKKTGCNLWVATRFGFNAIAIFISLHLKTNTHLNQHALKCGSLQSTISSHFLQKMMYKNE
uniref:hypothetical protein n=1 Tax=Pseudoalteromonas issachenkonii TaxID=152297 RepID=UPI0023535394